MLTETELNYLKGTHLFKSDGRNLIEFYRLLATAEKAHKFNPNPVELKEEFIQLNPKYIAQAKNDLEEIFKKDGISADVIIRHLK